MNPKVKVMVTSLQTREPAQLAQAGAYTPQASCYQSSRQQRPAEGWGREGNIRGQNIKFHDVEKSDRQRISLVLSDKSQGKIKKPQEGTVGE